ncbi:ribosome hibernation-promoting factor, HPF/YfiA family [Micromonospora chalcea]
MDIVVKGRNVEVPDHYRVHVAEKLAKIERYDQKLIRVDVELFHERNPRQADHCQRVEITCVTRGPVIRAEACTSDFYSALDAAIAKLDTRFRRAADRRRVHRGRHAPISVAAATAGLPVAELDGPGLAARDGHGAATAVAERPDEDGYVEPDDQPWHIARAKVHPATAIGLLSRGRYRARSGLLLYESGVDAMIAKPPTSVTQSWAPCSDSAGR